MRGSALSDSTLLRRFAQICGSPSREGLPLDGGLDARMTRVPSDIPDGPTGQLCMHVNLASLFMLAACLQRVRRLLLEPQLLLQLLVSI